MTSPVTKRYPHVIQHSQWCRNGLVPDAAFATVSRNAQNHILGYRKKVVFQTSDRPLTVGHTSSGTAFRFRCQTGHGTTHLVYVLWLALSTDSANTDPTVVLTTKIAGGATTTNTIHFGIRGVIAPYRTLNEATIRTVRVAVTANTTYECAIAIADYGCVQSACVYEEGEAAVDSSVDYYMNPSAGMDQPIYAADRYRHLRGLSHIWRHNGAHVLNYSPLFGAKTNATTTFKNVIDNSTSVTAATPGFNVFPFLENSCRLSDSKAIDLIFAVHGKTSAGSDGEVKLQNASGAIVSITNISTTEQWYTTTVSVPAVDTVGKVDIWFRKASAGTTTLNAVSVYEYLT
jgi:hypothetical protein